jgi:hypothetical protein
MEPYEQVANESKSPQLPLDYEKQQVEDHVDWALASIKINVPWYLIPTSIELFFGVVTSIVYIILWNQPITSTSLNLTHISRLMLACVVMHFTEMVLTLTTYLVTSLYKLIYLQAAFEKAIFYIDNTRIIVNAIIMIACGCVHIAAFVLFAPIVNSGIIFNILLLFYICISALVWLISICWIFGFVVLVLYGFTMAILPCLFRTCSQISANIS